MHKRIMYEWMWDKYGWFFVRARGESRRVAVDRDEDGGLCRRLASRDRRSDETNLGSIAKREIRM